MTAGASPEELAVTRQAAGLLGAGCAGTGRAAVPDPFRTLAEPFLPLSAAGRQGDVEEGAGPGPLVPSVTIDEEQAARITGGVWQAVCVADGLRAAGFRHFPRIRQDMARRPAAARRREPAARAAGCDARPRRALLRALRGRQPGSLAHAFAERHNVRGPYRRSTRIRGTVYSPETDAPVRWQERNDPARRR
jgi:hypothetical protein